jgi:hypothetical protein
VGWVDGHFRKGKWVRGHHRRSPGGGATNPEAEKQFVQVVLVLFAGACALVFGGCGIAIIASQCATEPPRYVQPDQDRALAEAAERENRAKEELRMREAEAAQQRAKQTPKKPAPSASKAAPTTEPNTAPMPEAPF